MRCILYTCLVLFVYDVLYQAQKEYDDSCPSLEQAHTEAWGGLCLHMWGGGWYISDWDGLKTAEAET